MDSWPTWARELNLDTKWAKGAEVLEVDGVSFLVVDRYGLDRTSAIALAADSAEFDFKFQVLPHPKNREKVQVLVWKDSDGRA